MGEDDFELARSGPPDEIAELPTRVAAGLRSGEVRLASGAHALRLAPPPEIKFGLRAEQKAEKGKLTFEIRWKRPVATTLSELTIQVRPAPARA